MQRLPPGLHRRMSVAIAWAPFGNAICCCLNAICALTFARVPFGNAPRSQIERNAGLSLTTATAWIAFRNMFRLRAIRKRHWQSTWRNSVADMTTVRAPFGIVRGNCLTAFRKRHWPSLWRHFFASLAISLKSIRWRHREHRLSQFGRHSNCVAAHIPWIRPNSGTAAVTIWNALARVSGDRLGAIWDAHLLSLGRK